MGTLFANLNSSANALAAFQRSLDVAQNNVSNASTAGYAKQLPTLNAQPFDLQNGILGSLNNLLQSFSNWSANPDSAAARQDVLAKAQDLGASFQQTMSVLSSATDSIDNK